MTVSELMRRMTNKEFLEWMAYFRIEPFGPPADDVRMGTIAAVMANIHKKQGVRPNKPADFAPWADETPYLADEDRIEKLFENMGHEVIEVD